jgi:HK97 family phage prohead protease
MNAQRNEVKRIGRPFELKKLSAEGQFSGYGSVFGVEDSYMDIVMPGAFAESLKARKPAMLWQHNPDQPIGVWTEAREDKTGLYLEGQLAMKTQAGAEAYELMKMGALDGLSIGFSTKVAEYDDKTSIRRLLQVKLWEVSPVTFPANEEARIENVKAVTIGDAAAMGHAIGKLHGMCSSCVDCGSQSDLMGGLDSLAGMLGGSEGSKSKPKTIRQLEAALRDAGLSREEAKALLAEGFTGLRDAGPEAVREQREAAPAPPSDVTEGIGELVSMLRKRSAR